MKKIPTHLKSENMLYWEEKLNTSIETFLWYEHVFLGKSSSKIAEESGINYKTLSRWAKKAGLYSHKLTSILNELEGGENHA